MGLPNHAGFLGRSGPNNLGGVFTTMISKKRTWEQFLAEATDVFVKKNTDYDSQFMRALVEFDQLRGFEAAEAIWAWEVEKKLSRIRTWISRGELQVKGEGVHDSVIDLFNYTVQFVMFKNRRALGFTDIVAELNERTFFEVAAKTTHDNLTYFLVTNDLLSRARPLDMFISATIREEMGLSPIE